MTYAVLETIMVQVTDMTGGDGAMLDPQVLLDTLGVAMATGGEFAEVFVEDRRSTSALLDDSNDIQLADREDVGRMPAFMLIPTIGLVIVGLSLTVFAGRIIDISDRAAADLRDRSVYIDAVRGDGFLGDASEAAEGR